MSNDKENAALRVVDAAQLDALNAQAAAAPRKRSHLLMHASHSDVVQRLIISAQPGTYVRPHQHSQQWEMLILQDGCMDVVSFDHDGKVESRITLDRNAPILHIAKSAWHTCIVREPRTVVIEVKPGPYVANEFAAWSPEEGQEDSAKFVAWAASASIGQQWQRT